VHLFANISIMTQTTLATSTSVETTITALKSHHYDAMVVQTKEEALKKIKELIPAGVSVMNGASKTLEQIGYIDYLKEGKHGWRNLHADILAETDPVKQGVLRKQSVLSDYYLGSVHALTETGEMVFASNSGSQLPHLAFTSPNIILVVGAQKITPTLTDALNRVEEVVIPLEDERMKGVYGFGTMYAKTLILRKENPAIGRSIKVIIVNEPLGF
jgi:hypothetical protein